MYQCFVRLSEARSSALGIIIRYDSRKIAS